MSMPASCTDGFSIITKRRIRGTGKPLIPAKTLPMRIVPWEFGLC